MAPVSIQSTLPQNSTSTRSTETQRRPSLIQTYALVSTARRKLSQESAQGSIRLRLVVGHANVLDGLMDDLHALELEQERAYARCRAAVAAECGKPDEKSAPVARAEGEQKGKCEQISKQADIVIIEVDSVEGDREGQDNLLLQPHHCLSPHLKQRTTTLSLPSSINLTLYSNGDSDSDSDSSSDSDDDFDYADSADEEEDQNVDGDKHDKHDKEKRGMTSLPLRPASPIATLLKMPGSRVGEKTRALLASRPAPAKGFGMESGISLAAQSLTRVC